MGGTARMMPPDVTPLLLARPYDFVSGTARRLGRDAFTARLLLQRATFLTGEAAVRTFYDEGRFVRAGAAPRRAKVTLFGVGGVQELDGTAHRVRKAMFVDLMSPEALDRFAALLEDRWRTRVPVWAVLDEVVLFDQAGEVLTEAVCAWAGVPLEPAHTAEVTGWMNAMIDAPAAVGPRYLRGRLARKHAERWAGDLVEQVRSGRLRPEAGTALHAVATHRDGDGTGLDRHTAAVELLNVIRPTVAIARFIVFEALALHSHPGVRDWLLAEPTDERVHAFLQEVRRFHPFFPLQAARARTDVDWGGEDIRRGQLVVLDLHGTDHDPRLYDRPEEFRPQRFVGREPTAYDLVPQGGGDHRTGHRCPGEWLTIRAMEVAARLLLELPYAVPPQDLTLRPSRAPAIPRSRFVLTVTSPHHHP